MEAATAAEVCVFARRDAGRRRAQLLRPHAAAFLARATLQRVPLSHARAAQVASVIGTLMTGRDLAAQREANVWLNRFTTTHRAWEVSAQLVLAPATEARARRVSREPAAREHTRKMAPRPLAERALLPPSVPQRLRLCRRHGGSCVRPARSPARWR